MAILHLNPLYEAERGKPEEPALLLRRGNLFAGSGKWKPAADDFARAFALKLPEDAVTWFRHALLRLRVGDTKGYQLLCQQMVDRFGHSQGYAAHLLDHSLALAPNSGLGAAQLVQRAQRQQPSDPSQRAWYCYTLGLALYRAGKFEKATACLQQLLQTDGQWRERVLAWLVLAMAHGQLGETDEARQWLERANQWYAVETRKFPPEASGGIPPSWAWQDWVSFQLLHQEAEGLVKRAGTDQPARKVKEQSSAKTPDR